MTDELEIPAFAFSVKAWFKDRPERAIVNELHEHIRSQGTPHLWRGHTHTAPSKGARVTFLGKYKLPETHKMPEKWAPCPCCRLYGPKYFRCGLIAWFPDEHVIRCVGDQCYKKMDPEGYKLAMDQFNLEIATERDNSFVAARFPAIPGIAATLEQNLATLAAIDQVTHMLSATIRNRLNIDIWREVKEGVLRLFIVETHQVLNAHGTYDTMGFGEYSDYARLPGYLALRPKPHKLKERAADIILALKSIDLGADAALKVEALVETERRQIIKIFRKAMTMAEKLVAEATEIRRFFTPEAIASITGWGKQDDVPVPIWFKLSDTGVEVGKPDRPGFKVPYVPHFWANLQPIPKLSEIAA